MPTPDGNRPLCIGCDQRPPSSHTLTCPHCRTRLVNALDDIARGYPLLDPTPGRTGSHADRATPGYGSRSPARDNVLVLTDRRGAAHDPDTPKRASALVRAVGWWADEARDAGLLDPPQRVIAVDRRGAAAVLARTVTGECAALTAIVDELGGMWWFGDMLEAIEAQARHVRRALGDVDPTIPLGTCPRPATEHAAAFALLAGDVGLVLAARASPLPRCAGEVRARTLGQSARCHGCGWRWDSEDELRLLGAMLGDALLDLPALARYLGVSSPATLRSWAMRDRWRRVKIGRRTVYRLADARTSWWRALDRRQAAASGAWRVAG